MYIEYCYNPIVPDNSALADVLGPMNESDTTITEAKKLIVNDIVELLTNTNPVVSKYCMGFSIDGDKTIGWNISDGSSDPVLGNSELSITSNGTYEKTVTFSTLGDKSTANAGFSKQAVSTFDASGNIISVQAYYEDENVPNQTVFQLRFIVSDPLTSNVVSQSKTNFCEFYAFGGTIFISASSTHLIMSGLGNLVTVNTAAVPVKVQPTFGVADFAPDDPSAQNASIPAYVYFTAASFAQIMSNGATPGQVYPPAVFDVMSGGFYNDYTPPPYNPTGATKGITMTVRYQKLIHGNTQLKYLKSDLTPIKCFTPIIVEYDQNVVLQESWQGRDPNASNIIYSMKRWVQKSYYNYTNLGGNISDVCGIYIVPPQFGSLAVYQTIKDVNTHKKYCAWPAKNYDDACQILIEVR